MAVVLAATVALSLPENFNPETNMVYKLREGKRMHQSREAASLARRLVANGTAEDISQAIDVLNATFLCQEKREADPDRGNFWWYREDGKVTDRNGAPFVLSSLIPMMLEHGDRLPDATRQATRESIHFALEAVERLDVTQLYTNIAIKDFVNTILGGQLLSNQHFRERGQKRFLSWMQLTDTNGIPVEYNSPTYYRVAIRSLDHLARLASDPDTRSRTRTALARLGLSKALHIHPKTRRMSGPHGRAYQNTIQLEDTPEQRHILKWIDEGTLPFWIKDAMDQQPAIFELHETPLKQMQAVISTRHTPSYAFGLATREWPAQANTLFAHYLRRGADRHGVIYARYLTDDKWLGSFYHATDRATDRNLSDEGSFRGVQNKGSAIGVYSLAVPFGGQKPDPVNSVKTTIIWQDGVDAGETRVGNRKVDLPATVEEGETVVVISRSILSAVRPLSRSHLGNSTQAILDNRNGDLVLDLYSYSGQPMEHKALHKASRGRHYGAFYFEIAERSEYANVDAFHEAVASASIRDTLIESDDGTRLSIGFERPDRNLGLEIDLESFDLKRRWDETGDLGFPMLESPIARENQTGRVEVGDAVLTCGKEAGWLFAPPGTGRYVAAYHGLEPAPLKLEVPGGSVKIAAMGTGTVVWDNGQVTIDAIALEGAPIVAGGQLSQ